MAIARLDLDLARARRLRADLAAGHGGAAAGDRAVRSRPLRGRATSSGRSRSSSRRSTRSGDFACTGTMPADPRRPYVVVSNHESFVDILLISHLPWEMKWLSKAEMFRIPVLGWLLRLAGDIPVQRGFGPSAIEAIARCREALANRVSVMIFPEGTRSTTAELLPFKDGAFRLAIDAGVPILPLVVHGTVDRAPQARLAVRPLDRRGASARAGRDHGTHSRRRPRAQGSCAAAHRRNPGRARRGAPGRRAAMRAQERAGVIPFRDRPAPAPAPPPRPAPAA